MRFSTNRDPGSQNPYSLIDPPFSHCPRWTTGRWVGPQSSASSCATAPLPDRPRPLSRWASRCGKTTTAMISRYPPISPQSCSPGPMAARICSCSRKDNCMEGCSLDHLLRLLQQIEESRLANLHLATHRLPVKSRQAARSAHCQGHLCNE